MGLTKRQALLRYAEFALMAFCDDLEEGRVFLDDFDPKLIARLLRALDR